ncbi:MAG: PTS sugar transporter subunit IIB [Chloroflexi bacterium]|nr:PTS sugar transporter subunit IIB [Chloroflexota bacterium]
MAEPLVAFALVRMDDRLLHGQVALNWVRQLRPSCVAIVDQALASAPETHALYRLALPEQVGLWIGEPAAAAEALLGDGAVAPGAILVLVRGPTEALALFEAGVRYAALNLGMRGAAPGRARVSRQLSLSLEDRATLHALVEHGVHLTAQALPSDAPLSWREIACRVER